MGKGDKRTKRGKIFKGSYGKFRRRKKEAKAQQPKPKEKEVKTE